MFIKRVISSVFSITIIGIVIFLLPNLVYSLIVTLLIGLGLNEFYSLVSKKGIYVYKYAGIALGLFIPVLVHLKSGGLLADLEPFYIVLSCLFIILIQFIRKNSSEALGAISVTMFGILYISWFFSFLIKIKFMPGGALLAVFIVLVTKAGDIGAYIVGRAFGRHQLIPRISPGKSKEGMAGGLIFSLAAALGSKAFISGFAYHELALLGVFLGLMGQLGDLSESLIKRDCGVKDSGKGLPGLGGVLDLIDSLLFTAPIFYFYIKGFAP